MTYVKSKIFSILLVILLLPSIFVGCSSSNNIADDTEQTNTEIATSYHYKTSTNNDDSIVVNNVLYYCDNFGVWKKESGKEEVQLSENSGNSISTNSETIIYSHSIDENDTKCSIHVMNSDGTNDREICTTDSYAHVMLIDNEKLYYSSYNNQKQSICLFSVDINSKESSVLAKNVFLCSVAKDNKLLYLDNGGSEFSIHAGLHLLDLETGDNQLVDNSNYSKSLYQDDDKVYTIKETAGDAVTYTLCMYDLNTGEQKELNDFFTASNNLGMHTLDVYKGEFFYVVEDYYSADTNYTFYKYSVSDDNLIALNYFPNEFCYFIKSGNDLMCIFNSAIYLYDNNQLTLIKEIENDEYYNIVEFFDNSIYYRDDYNLIGTYDAVAGDILSESSEQNKAQEVALYEHLNKSKEELINYFGDDYESVQIPGTGLMDCIAFDSCPDVAFGIDLDTGVTKVVSIVNCDQSFNLCEGVNSAMSGSELLALDLDNCTISEHYLAINDSQSVNLKYDNGLVIVFEWNTLDYSSPADMVSMQYRAD